MYWCSYMEYKLSNANPSSIAIDTSSNIRGEYQNVCRAIPKITKGSLSFALTAAPVKSNCMQTLRYQCVCNFITPRLK